THTGYRMSQTRDHFVYFMSGKLPPLTGFGALRHLDLQFVRVDQIIRCHAKSCRGDLLASAASQVTACIWFEAPLVLAAFSGIRLPSNPVHGNRESLMCFFANRPERHCTRGKALHDFLG